MQKKQFFRQGMLLTAVSFFMRVTGIAYRSYLARIMGTEGLGLYQLIFTVFTLSVTLSTSGISLAVTRITAARLSGQSRTLRSALRRCFGWCLCISGTMAVLFLLLAPTLAHVFLKSPDAAPALRLLAPGLPFMSLCTCMRGYFLAVDEALSTVSGDLAEQFLTIGATALLLSLFRPQTPAAACTLAMAASSAGEIAGCLLTWVLYRRSLRRHTPAHGDPARGIFRILLHIALPGTLSSAVRNFLGTAENLLIPRGLQRFGASRQASVAAYGILQGMAFPALLFPSAFLSAFSSLLVPQIAGAHAAGNLGRIRRLTQRSLAAAAAFSSVVTAFFLFFGEETGTLLFGSTDAGRLLRLFSPLVLLLYLDGVVDAILKGMDEQLSAFRYNTIDASVRVLLVLLFLPQHGLPAYIGIVFFSTIFNASMSIRRLLQVTGLQVDLIRGLLLPFLYAGTAVFCCRMLLHFFHVL